MGALSHMETYKFKKEVEITLTPQALKVLAGSKYSVEDYINWELNIKKITLGGHNVTLFLEKMYDKEHGSTDS